MLISCGSSPEAAYDFVVDEAALSERSFEYGDFDLSALRDFLSAAEADVVPSVSTDFIPFL